MLSSELLNSWLDLACDLKNAQNYWKYFLGIYQEGLHFLFWCSFPALVKKRLSADKSKLLRKIVFFHCRMVLVMMSLSQNL